jgi:phosphatidylethanolamine/phosphatidyl-N-methylethanolamine N-methyltransferase
VIKRSEILLNLISALPRSRATKTAATAGHRPDQTNNTLRSNPHHQTHRASASSRGVAQDGALTRTTAFMAIALARQGTVGAILPSSRQLADAMARAAGGAQYLIELGAGTGAITEALRRRHPGVPTLAVELEPVLARHLRERFPRIEVRVAAAHEVLRDLPHRPGFTTLISSLPFRSLPPRLRLRSSLAIERFLIGHPSRRLVQYTYLPRAPFELRLGASLHWQRLEVVWGNVPPAWVWELRCARH